MITEKLTKMNVTHHSPLSSIRIVIILLFRYKTVKFEIIYLEDINADLHLNTEWVLKREEELFLIRDLLVGDIRKT